MGQKVNPVGLRLGINRTWDSRWYSGKGEYGTLLHEDIKIRKVLMEALKQAAVSTIVIERPHKKCRETAQAGRSAHRQRRRDQHRGDSQAGARRSARLRVDRPAA
jgi:hypothetical protein